MAEHSIKNTLETVAGYIGEEVKDVLDEKEDIFRVDTMPVASADYVGKIVQYTGTTNTNYTNGYFYKCVAHEEESGGETITTYAWEQKLVQDGGDSRIGQEIKSIGVRSDITLGYVPYITMANPLKEFTQSNLIDIAMVAKQYYDGDLTLQQIQDYWAIGDEVDLPLSAMSAEYVAETHAAQTAKMKIIDFEHDVLTTSKGGKTNALLTFGFLLNENGKMSDDNAHGYSTSLRRSWCNDTCFNALPAVLKNVIVSVEKTNGIGAEGNGSGTRTTSDLLFIPNLTEFYIGGFAPGRMYRTYHIDTDGGSRYEWWKTDSHLSVGKALWTATSAQYYNSDSMKNIYNLWMYINGASKNDAACTDNMGLYVHGCI